MTRFAIGLFLLFPALVAGQRSPFNGSLLHVPDSATSYRMLISGHFYGGGARNGLPAATVLAGIDTMNALAPHLLVSTGDLFLRPEDDSAQYATALFAKLRMPLFNAPGNHDMEGPTYLRSYGPTFQSLALGPDRLVLLDTERDNGDLAADQLDLLEALVSSEPPVRNVFIVSHRPIWAEGDARYGPLFEGNTRSVMPANFRSTVRPVLWRLAQRSKVHWISGSMAGGAPASIFFQPDTLGIVYIQAAVRDEPRDALLLADVGPTGIDWRTISLTGRPVERPEAYDAAFWARHKGTEEPFNWRMLPYLTRKTVFSRSFGIGLATGLLLLLLLRRIFRRWL